MIKGNIWGNIKNAVRSWRWWSDHVVNSNVKDLAVLPPLYVNKLHYDWLDQTVINLWPNGRLYLSKETQNDTFIPTVNLHEWISPSYILKWENAEIVKKICWTFHNAIERYSERWQKALSNVLRAQNIYTEYIHFEWEDKKDLKEWKYKSKS